MSHAREFHKLIIQGLPIALIILYVLFPALFRKISSLPLGKCIAVVIIILYTFQDMMFGFVVCLLVILFYQRDATEGFLSKPIQNYVEFLPKPSLKEDSITFDSNSNTDFTSVNEAYPENLPPIRKVSEQLFRREFCHSTENRVTFKNQKVNNSLVTHVYPELEFREGECNPCDRTCHFNINRKHDTEVDLQPVSSKYSSIVDVAYKMISS